MIESICSILDDAVRLTGTLRLADLAASDSMAMLACASRMKRRLETGNRAERRALLLEVVARIELQRNCVSIGVSASAMRALLDVPHQSDTAEQRVIWLDIPVQLRRRGAELKLVFASGHAAAGKMDPNLVTAVTQGHRWFEQLRSGTAKSIADLARRHGIHQADVSRVLPLAFLAPDIVQDILDGRQPVELTAARLKRIRLPHNWAAQRQILGFTG